VELLEGVEFVFRGVHLVTRVYLFWPFHPAFALLWVLKDSNSFEEKAKKSFGSGQYFYKTQSKVVNRD
jgi:hypothetical protein